MASSEEADYTLSEDKDGKILVRVRVPNLKPKSKGLLAKISGGRKDQAKNASIECDFQERSFTLVVTGQTDKGMENKQWTLTPSNMTNPIDPNNSYWQVQEGFVYVYLKKANSGDNWSSLVQRGEL